MNAIFVAVLIETTQGTHKRKQLRLGRLEAQKPQKKPELHEARYLQNSKAVFVSFKKLGKKILGIDNVEIYHRANF